MEKNYSDVNKFWANFRDSVLKNDIPESQADSYVKWAENFAVSIKGRDRDANDFMLFCCQPLCERGWGGGTRMNKQSNFTTYLFHPHPTSPIKGEELHLILGLKG